MDIDQALGLTVRSLRTEKGWSQTELALRADIDRNYLSLIELGKNSPSVRLLSRLCAALGVSTSTLLSEVEARLAVQPRPKRATR
ncbi:helix-turn-helix transcriptional regulator [beta proteobacterium MWH-UniP1]